MKKTKRGAKCIGVMMLVVIFIMESVSMPVSGEVNKGASMQTEIASEQISDNSVEKYTEETISANFVLSEEAEVSVHKVFKEDEEVAPEKSAIVYSGTDGNLEWSIDSEGLLTVEGKGDYEDSADWLSYRSYIETAYVNVQEITSMKNFFYRCSNLKVIDFADTDTSNVTDMSGVFYGCSKLYGLNVDSFNTGKVTTMEKMFYECRQISRIKLNDFNTSNVTNMAEMFQGCSDMDKVDVSGFDTGNVTNMSGLFSNCSNLKSIDISTFDMSQVTTVKAIFHGCSSLEEVVLGKPDTGQVENMGSMFSGCKTLEEIDVSQLDTANVTSMGSMFAECESVTELDLSTFDMSQVGDTRKMFYNCSGLEKLDLGKSEMENLSYTPEMFRGCDELQELDLSTLHTSKVVDMEGMFMECRKVKELDVSHFDTSNVRSMKNMFYECADIQELELDNFETGIVIDMSGMFYGCASLEKMDVSDFDTSAVKYMDSMFYGCASLKKLDISNFVTSKVIYMSSMFQGCSVLTELKLGEPDVAEVITMSHMFDSCKSLKSLDVSDFNSYKTTNMSYMFKNCSGLTELKVWGLDTTAVKNMSGMFQGCSSLTSLTPVNYTSAVTNMSYMFQGCSSLTYLDLSDFGVHNVTTMAYMFGDCSSLNGLRFYGLNSSELQNMDGMFYRCSSLKEIDLRNFNTTSVTDIRCMFYGCSSLTNVDASIFNRSKIYAATMMFAECDNLTSIDLTDLNVDSLLYYDGMFQNCDKLISVCVGSAFMKKLVSGTSPYFKGSELFSEIYFEGTSVEWAEIRPLWQECTEKKVRYASIHFSDGTIEQELQHEGTFQYIKYGGFGSQTQESYIYNCDLSQFFGSSYKYHHNLAQMSIRVSMAAMSDDTHVDSSNIEALMNDLNLSKKEIHYPEPDYESIGYAIGARRIYYNNQKKTLIMVAIRGGGYGSEWGGNANVGYGIEHAGFDIAADKVEEGIHQYLSDLRECGFIEEDDKDIVVWISGYSRGAATANLLAAKLDDNYYMSTVMPEIFVADVQSNNVFAYCFECPRNTTNEFHAFSRYRNIYNIINLKDLVTNVAMNNGVDWRFQRYGIDIVLPDEINTNWSDYAKYKLDMELEYQGEETPEFKIGQAIFVKDAAKRLGNIIHKAEYVQYYQGEVQALAVAFMAKKVDIEKFLINTPIVLSQLFPILWKSGSLEFDLLALEIIAIKDSIIDAHLPELCMAWMDSVPEEVLLMDKSVIRITISSPGDVYVYQDEKVVGAIENGQTRTIDNGVVTLLDDNNQMVIVLPGDSTYDLEYKATEDGQLSISTSRYVQAEAVPENVLCYFDMPIEAGNVYEANVADSAFKLVDALGNIVKPTVTQSGEEVIIYKVDIDLEGNGSVTGVNTYTLGETAKVVAYPNEKEEFLGWYKNDTLISQDKEYRFCVKSDTMLVAKFTQNVKEDVDEVQKNDEVKGKKEDAQYVINKNTYKITNNTKKTVTFVKTTSKSKTIKIPATVNINGEKYKVTAVAANAMKGNKRVTKIVIGSNVTCIGKKAFYKCTFLKTITIPAKVKTIGESAFNGCKKLTKVILGKGITKIGKKAFYNCKKLKNITIKSKKLNSVGKYAFKGIANQATIKCPGKKLKKYSKMIKKSKIGKKVKIK